MKDGLRPMFSLLWSENDLILRIILVIVCVMYICALGAPAIIKRDHSSCPVPCIPLALCICSLDFSCSVGQLRRRGSTYKVCVMCSTLRRHGLYFTTHALHCGCRGSVYDGMRYTVAIYI